MVTDGENFFIGRFCWLMRKETFLCSQANELNLTFFLIDKTIWRNRTNSLNLISFHEWITVVHCTTERRRNWNFREWLWQVSCFDLWIVFWPFVLIYLVWIFHNWQHWGWEIWANQLRLIRRCYPLNRCTWDIRSSVKHHWICHCRTPVIRNSNDESSFISVIRILFWNRISIS